MALMFLLPQRKKRKQVQIVSRETDSSINQQRLTAVTECYYEKIIRINDHFKSQTKDVLVFDLPTINVITEFNKRKDFKDENYLTPDQQCL